MENSKCFSKAKRTEKVVYYPGSEGHSDRYIPEPKQNNNASVLRFRRRDSTADKIDHGSTSRERLTKSREKEVEDFRKGKGAGKMQGRRDNGSRTSD